MSVTETLGGSLSPEENAFFESGGNSAIPSDASTATTSDGSESSTSDRASAEKTGEPSDKSDKSGDKTPSTVPLAALHEERARRKEIDKQYRETQQQLAELRGKFSIVEKLGLPAAAETQAPKVPTAEEDIFGNVKHVGETVAQLQKRLDDADAATKAASEQQTFVNSYRADAAKFEQTTPDFKQAYDFILKSRAAELQAIGYDTPQALHEALTADEFAIAQMALSKGKSPAEMLYTLAKQRGYKAAEVKAADTGKAAEQLATIERGQNANKSLASTGGNAGDAEVTAQQLIDMPADDFEAWVAKNPAKAKRIMGG